jgi:ribosome maturation factor RimP
MGNFSYSQELKFTRWKESQPYGARLNNRMAGAAPLAQRRRRCTIKTTTVNDKWAKAHFFICVARGYMRQELTDKIWEIADRVARAIDVEVVDIEFLGGGKHRVLRIFVDKEGGVTHGDCQLISTGVEEVLDAGDIVPGGEYTLEVSSPGVERKLSRPRDFEKCIGKKVKVVLREPMANSTTWIGVLQAFNENILTVETADAKTARIPLDNVKKANLKFEW